MRWKAITDALVASAKELPSVCKSGPAGSCGPWSEMTTDLTAVSLEHVRCNTITLGSSRQVEQNACCSYASIARAVLKGAKDAALTSAERDQLIALLTRQLPSAVRGMNDTQLVNFMAQHFGVVCGGGTGMLETPELQNVIDTASSSTTCDALQIALNQNSSSITCILSMGSDAQRKLAPDSWTPPKRAVSPTVILAVVLLGLVLVVGCVAWISRRAARRRAFTELKGVDVDGLDGLVDEWMD